MSSEVLKRFRQYFLISLHLVGWITVEERIPVKAGIRRLLVAPKKGLVPSAGWLIGSTQRRKPSLWRPVIKHAGLRFFLGIGFMAIIWSSLMVFINGWILPQLISWLRENAVGSGPSANKALPVWSGWVLAASLCLLTLIQQLFVHQYFFLATETGLRVSTAIKALIYRKSLRLASNATSVGTIVNMQSNDTMRLFDVFRYGHPVWITPLQIIVHAALLVQYVGWRAALIGSAACLLIVPAQSLLGRLIGRIKHRTMPITDSRVSIMNEILSSIKLVKLYNWEQPFADQVANAREREMVGLRKISIIKGFNNAFATWSAPLVAFVTFAVSSSLEPAGTFTLTSAFTALALFNSMRKSLSSFSIGAKALSESLVCVRRLTAFLMDEESTRQIRPQSPGKSAVMIKLRDATFAFDSKSNAPALKNLKLSVKKGECVAIIGAVGSGKSSLLLALADQLHLCQGDAQLTDSIAYVAQTPWLMNSSLKENILFSGIDYPSKYQKVIRVCQLESDLQQLPDGDQSEIGERGLNLSGGQKSRVALARAVYSEKDIYLLDDPLAAVDQHVGNRLFHDCIRGALKNKTVILVTNQLQYLPYCDKIIVLKNGEIDQIGTFAQLSENPRPELARLSRDFVADFVPEKSRLKSPDVLNIAGRKHSSDVATPGASVVANAVGRLVHAEDRVSGSVAGGVYKRYFASGGWGKFIWICCLSILLQAVRVVSDWWISEWAKNAYPSQPASFYIWICSILLGTFAIALVVKSISYAFFTLRASTVLHNGVFSRVLRAPMHFFDATPLGRILNRFTKDQDNIDDVLPDAFDQATQSLLTVLAAVVLIASVLWWFAIAIIPLGALFWFLGLYYRRTSRQIKRLDGTTRSEVFSHLSATLNGLSTLRAYGAEKQFEEMNRRKLDMNACMQFHSEIAIRWLAIRLDLVSVIIITVTVFLSVAMKDAVPASLSVLAISYALQTTNMLQFGVRNMAETENQMTSVERLLAYTTDLPQEAPGVVAERRPPPNWPTKPSIQFKRVELRYRVGLEPALRRVSFKIKPKEKVGIVGRTGAGKSTLAISLFRILEPSHGSIIVDGVDILKIGLSDLRSKLAIIPQDPVLFKNTIRYNLDPFGQHEDAKLWETLDKIFLKDVVSALPHKLDTLIQENGSNFSAGQRQLICFGRAVLRGSSIVVLDEATASIDMETDERIQRTIRETFEDCTVLTIAHRLHTIIDYDKIMLLNHGTIAEFDRPSKLLARQSAFGRLIDETGPETSAHLRSLVQKQRQPDTRHTKGKKHRKAQPRKTDVKTKEKSRNSRKTGYDSKYSTQNSVTKPY